MPNINKNIIKQAGAAVANATNKAAGLSASTPEPGSIISAIQLVNGGREIGPSGLAHFTESVRNKLLSLLVSMEPIQDFNGYGHPWPAGGGKNLLVPRLPSLTQAGITMTNNGDGSFNFVGTATANTNFRIDQISVGSTSNLRSYTAPFVMSMSSTATVGTLFLGGYKDGTWTTPDCSVNSNTKVTDNIDNAFAYIRFNNGDTVNATFYPQIEYGSTATSWEPYENICPISGRTGLNGYIGPTDSIGDAATYSMDWTSPAGTVYAGSADIVTGDIKAAPYYASYNGETLVGPWISSMDEYDPEGTPTTGAQVVDLGGTMAEYHITGQDIITLVGDNYIWSDSGDVTITE